MITKEEYQKTLIRMWDSIRDKKHKGESDCAGVNCVGCDWYNHEYNFCSYLTYDGTNCDEKLPCEKEDNDESN